MKILPVGTSFSVRTDRQTGMTNLTVTLRVRADVPKKRLEKSSFTWRAWGEICIPERTSN